MLEAQELEGGETCFVLERRGRDKLWVDPKKNFSLIRRDFFHPGGRRIWERTTYGDYQKVGNCWFPGFLQRDEFGTPKDKDEFANQVCNRKIIDRVSILEPDANGFDFRIGIQDGDLVQDDLRGVTYICTKQGDPPFELQIL